jgi:6-phosphogluconolactonase (cycloisomerase 2 family)
MLKVHEDEICALHLDEINMIIYSASIDGWLNIIDANRVVLIDTLELSCNITTFIPDTTNMRIFVSLAEGNIEIYEYSHNAKLKHLHSIATPVEGEMKSLLFDPMKNYLFAASYESGEVFIF